MHRYNVKPPPPLSGFDTMNAQMTKNVSNERRLLQCHLSSLQSVMTHVVAYFISQSAMEAAISTLVSQFKACAGKDGSANTLSKEEFQNLVSTHLPNLVKLSSDPGAIDQLMSSLDENNDGELTFSEFWQLIGKLASKQAGLS
ncbi:hypothetical protein WMY93_019744 [Mugilogobius chulae]|uniref:EF-hand domain-containing protein n=1 Tax=Mugilogobius chulae TaxID=88201 RepID=A0AAW0NFB8_9GOBI